MSKRKRPRRIAVQIIENYSKRVEVEVVPADWRTPIDYEPK